MIRSYLDNAATTRLHAEVAEVMALAADLGNPSSLHALGREARELLEEARAGMASQLGVSDPGRIFITSGATESNNLAILGVARHRGRGHIVASAIEHSAVTAPLRYLRQQGFEVTEVPVDRAGRVDPGDVLRALRPDTILVSILLASNEIGTIQPIAQIKEAIGEVPLHTDAAQAGGKMRLDLAALKADLVTLSGHKIHGPRGVGLLFVAPGVELESLLFGGPHEGGLRPGTENVAGAVGLSRALSVAHRDLEKNLRRMEEARLRLRRCLDAIDPPVVIHGSETDRLPTILTFSVPGAEGEALVLALDAEGIAASSGSACDSHSIAPSPVLRALGVSEGLARGSVRLSVAADTTDAEIDHAVDVIPGVIERLRDLGVG